VDVSQNFIEWSKRNFEINQVASSDLFRFWVQDCLFFMKMSVKKEKKWDLVICDPPTFGRSKNGVFQIEKNFDELLQNIFSCTEKNGRILFSLNFEKWSQQDLIIKVEKALKGQNFTIEKTPFQSLDFDFPHHEHLMKSLIIKHL
jgi:23S rRNA (cytosine1962-C5)-methyltransferase